MMLRLTFSLHIYLWLLFGLAFTNGFTSSTIRRKNHQQNRNSILPATAENGNDDETLSACKAFVLSKTYTRRRFPPWRRSKKEEQRSTTYEYEFDILPVSSTQSKYNSSDTNRTGIVLIHPIGVGIGKWYYERLIQSFANVTTTTPGQQLYLVSPDLLGSGSATNISQSRRPPLFNISDWSHQLVDLMTMVESELNIDQWCLVANGGCSPIALQVAQQSVEGAVPFERPVSNVILSSVPRLPFFLEASNPQKVATAYLRLCQSGIGNLFWWYACRKKGAFIQTFSEKNLVADPKNLGDQWRINCFETAIRNDGQSKFSTFAFLAGTLQDGSVAGLTALQDATQHPAIHVIKGKDIRQQRAKSWFWQKRKRQVQADPRPSRKTFRDYLEETGLGGREIVVGGRISLAHEDAPGYRDAVLSFLNIDSI